MNAILCLTAALAIGQTRDPVVQFRTTIDQGHVVVAHMPGEAAAKLPMGKLTTEQGEAILTVGLVDHETQKAGPAMLGKYERKGNELTFTPRFPLGADQVYRADFHHPDKLYSVDFRVPKAAAKAAPKVVKIYPTASVLPANHLKFYIYFDRAMRGGKELFHQIVLVDDKGKEIEDSWLIDEIWDEETHCLIIYIHPGRIKWGVELRELMGPVLYEKREYSLVIRGTLTDLDGNKIGKDVVKKFRTTPEDRTRIDLSKVKIEPAIAGTSERVVVTFPKAIDHRSLQRFVRITDDQGVAIKGSVEIGQDEKTWALLPKGNWTDRRYYLHIDPQLEDVAGNTPMRAFDFDLKAPKLPEQKLRLEFKSIAN
jgi:hypothetical protein